MRCDFDRDVHCIQIGTRAEICRSVADFYIDGKFVERYLAITVLCNKVVIFAAQSRNVKRNVIIFAVLCNRIRNRAACADVFFVVNKFSGIGNGVQRAACGRFAVEIFEIQRYVCRAPNHREGARVVERNLVVGKRVVELCPCVIGISVRTVLHVKVGIERVSERRTYAVVEMQTVRRIGKRSIAQFAAVSKRAVQNNRNGTGRNGERNIESHGRIGRIRAERKRNRYGIRSRIKRFNAICGDRIDVPFAVEVRIRNGRSARNGSRTLRYKHLIEVGKHCAADITAVNNACLVIVRNIELGRHNRIVQSSG